MELLEETGRGGVPDLMENEMESAQGKGGEGWEKKWVVEETQREGVVAGRGREVYKSGGKYERCCILLFKMDSCDGGKSPICLYR